MNKNEDVTLLTTLLTNLVELEDSEMASVGGGEMSQFGDFHADGGGSWVDLSFIGSTPDFNFDGGGGGCGFGSAYVCYFLQ